MANEKNEADYKAMLTRIDNKLTTLNEFLRNQKPRETWVGVDIIQELTGWDKFWLEKARNNNLVQTRKKGYAHEYLLESLNPLFIKKLE